MLENLSLIIQNEFTNQEIYFLQKCVDKNIDLEALEISLRKINKDNILSFIFLYLSAIAESSTKNQDKFVNKKSLNTLEVFILLTKISIDFVLKKMKNKILYKKLLNEYSKCMM